MAHSVDLICRAAVWSGSALSAYAILVYKILGQLLYVQETGVNFFKDRFS